MARKKGRPTRFTKKLGDQICAELAEGLSLRTVCSDANMPDKSTVFRWLRLPSMKDFRDQYARAKEEAADAMAEDILYIADTPMPGEITTLKETDDGSETTTKREDMLGHRRLQVDTRKFLMAKMKPKKYGDKLDLSNDDRSLRPVTIFSMQAAVATKKLPQKAK